MILRSKIKKIFSDELLKLLASVCDTRRIDSAQRKMILIQQLLKKYNIQYSPLGGATNRIALFIDGYAIKFAIDYQGYRDNLIEYSICQELYPYVTKTYESNGYMVLCECVKTMTKDDFRLRRGDIMKVLEILSRDYLMGDVGYLLKNHTNWGIRDDGSVVILDYAYIHRGTEGLFTCDVCGDGILRYDATFSYLKCSNATVCNAKYEYLDRKTIQGHQVDLDMIEDVKAQSLKLPQGVTQLELQEDNGILIPGDKIIIHNDDEYKQYIEKENHKMNEHDASRMFDLLNEKAKAKTKEELDRINTEIDKITQRVAEEDSMKDVVFDYDEDRDTFDEIPNELVPDNDEPSAAEVALSLDDLVKAAKTSNCHIEPEVDLDDDIEGVDTSSIDADNIKIPSNVIVSSSDDDDDDDNFPVLGGTQINYDNEEKQIIEKPETQMEAPKETKIEVKVETDNYEGVTLNGKPINEAYHTEA